MPELPEVETIRRGITPHADGQTITKVVVRDHRLRFGVPRDLPQRLTGQRIRQIERRAKYLLLHVDSGALMLHLGMSGRLHVVTAADPPGKHAHLDIALGNGDILRLTDPRRFGMALWLPEPVAQHQLLAALGPEPMAAGFTPQTLHIAAKGRKAPIKNMIMDNHVVVGVGNIYASESLFRAGIHPKRAAGRVSAVRLTALHDAIRVVLAKAIEAGGTTLRDFSGADGNPGYFQQDVAVYGRDGQPCITCSTPIKRVVIGQRASYYCPRCQR